MKVRKLNILTKLKLYIFFSSLQYTFLYKVGFSVKFCLVLLRRVSNQTVGILAQPIQRPIRYRWSYSKRQHQRLKDTTTLTVQTSGTFYTASESDVRNLAWREYIINSTGVLGDTNPKLAVSQAILDVLYIGFHQNANEIIQ